MGGKNLMLEEGVSRLGNESSKSENPYSKWASSIHNPSFWRFSIRSIHEGEIQTKLFHY